MRVTVGIPTFNRAALLREAMESVLAQTFGDFRLLVSDNASTDDTAEVVASFRDDRVGYVRSEENVGVIRNFNRLVELTESDYFVLLPDDDILYPDHLESTVDVLERFDNVGVVHTAFDLIDADSRAIRRISPLETTEPVAIEPGERYLERSMMSSWSMCFSSIVYRRRALLDADRFRAEEEPFADVPLWLRIALGWDFGYVARPLAGFRMHPGTVTLSIGADEGLGTDARDRALLHSQIRLRRRREFLDEAALPPERTERLRSLSTLQFLVESASLGLPWAETMRTLLRLVRSHPAILLRSPVWRLAAAQLGGRRVRSIVRTAASRAR